MTPEPQDFFVTGGTLSSNAPSYVQRRADKVLFEAMRTGEFCYVLNSRQMGKSSLSVHTISRLQAENIATVFVDLTKLGGRNVTPDQWYAGLLAEIGRGLNLRTEFVKYFVEHKDLGPMQRLFGALREVGLEQIKQPICVFIDEIDATRALPFSTDEFFAGIRQCCNARVNDPEYKRLTFCLLGVAAPRDLIQDPKTTPFNIGKNVILRDFSAEEAAPLAAGLGVKGKEILERVLYWTGGQPFLTQSLCARLTKGDSVDELVETTFLEKNARTAHVTLADVANRVLNGYESVETIDDYRSQILTLYRQVLSGKSVTDDERNRLVTVLRLSGIVRVVEGKLKPRNRIYARVFDNHWINENMPGGELRRQQRAYRLGVLRAASIAGVVVAALVVLSGYSLVMARNASSSNAKANYELYVADINLMDTAWNQNNVDRLRQLLATTRSNRDRGWEWRLWDHLAHLDVFSVTDPEPGFDPTYSPEGKEIAMRYRSKMSFYDSSDGKVLRSFSMKLPSLNSAIWSPDGKKILDAASDQSLDFYDPTSGKLLLSIPAKQHTTSSRPFSPDGRYIVSSPSFVTGQSELKVWDANSGALVNTIRRPNRNTHSASFTSTGDILAIEWSSDGTNRGALYTWDMKMDRLGATMPTTTLPSVATVSPDGKRFVAGEASGWVEVFDGSTGQRLSRTRAHSGTVTSMDWSHDGHYLVTVGADRLARIWDMSQSSPQPVGEVRGASTASFSPDGNRLLAGFYDIRVYNWRTYEEAKEYPLPANRVGPIKIDTTGKFTFLNAGNVFRLDDQYGYHPLPDRLPAVGFASDEGNFLLLSLPDKEWEIVKAGEWTPRLKFKSASVIPLQLHVSADGSRAAVVDDDRSIDVYDLKRGKQIRRFFESELFTAADLSPDGRILITGNLFGVVKLWSVDSGKLLHTLVGHTRTVTSATFSPNGDRVITSADDGTARVWDVPNAKISMTLVGHSQSVLDAEFSPDQTRIVTASRDLTARIWDAKTGRSLVMLDGHDAEVLSAQFTPDGHDVVTSCADGKIRIWSDHKGRK
ncbi:AAA-like domain-containing protein [soil metagenome]